MVLTFKIVARVAVLYTGGWKKTNTRVLPDPLDVVQVPLSPVTSPVVAQNQQRTAFPKLPSPADT